MTNAHVVAVDRLVPRVLSIILLLVSLAMFIPLTSVVVTLSTGGHVPTLRWLGPICILGTASVMTWMLTRHTIPLRLYVAAFALWLVTAGYLFLLSER